MKVTCHPRLGGASRKGGGGHRHSSRMIFNGVHLVFAGQSYVVKERRK